MSNIKTSTERTPEFGDYVTIEQHRFYADNEFYTYKVISRLESNFHMRVPVHGHHREEEKQDEMVPVIYAVCDGVGRPTVQKFAISDVTLQNDGSWSRVAKPKEL